MPIRTIYENLDAKYLRDYESAVPAQFGVGERVRPDFLIRVSERG
jgi:hypothetical protein